MVQILFFFFLYFSCRAGSLACHEALQNIPDWFSCRYSGFKKTILLDRQKLVQLHQNRTLSWNEFANAVQMAHEKRMGQPSRRRVIPDKPKEEDYFYANPHECLCKITKCDDLLGSRRWIQDIKSRNSLWSLLHSNELERENFLN